MERITKPLHLLPLHVLITAPPIIRFSSPSALPAPTFIMPCTSKLNPLPPFVFIHRSYHRSALSLSSLSCASTTAAKLRLPSTTGLAGYRACSNGEISLSVQLGCHSFLLAAIHDTAERKTFSSIPPLNSFLFSKFFIYLSPKPFLFSVTNLLPRPFSLEAFLFFLLSLACSQRSVRFEGSRRIWNHAAATALGIRVSSIHESLVASVVSRSGRVFTTSKTQQIDDSRACHMAHDQDQRLLLRIRSGNSSLYECVCMDDESKMKNKKVDFERDGKESG